MLFHYHLLPWDVNELTLYQFKYLAEEFAWLQGTGGGQSTGTPPMVTGKKPGEMMSLEEVNAMAESISGVKVSEEKKRQWANLPKK